MIYISILKIKSLKLSEYMLMRYYKLKLTGIVLKIKFDVFLEIRLDLFLLKIPVLMVVVWDYYII